MRIKVVMMGKHTVSHDKMYRQALRLPIVPVPRVDGLQRNQLEQMQVQQWFTIM